MVNEVCFPNQRAPPPAAALGSAQRAPGQGFVDTRQSVGAADFETAFGLQLEIFSETPFDPLLETL